MGQIICAWCGKKIGEKEGTGDTHTICPSCKRKEKKRIDDYYKKKKE